MQKITKVVLVIVLVNVILLNFLYSYSKEDTIRTFKTETNTEFFAADQNDKSSKPENTEKAKLEAELKALLKEKERIIQSMVPEDFEGVSIFKELGAYPKIGEEYFAASGLEKPEYHLANYQLFHDDDYCYNVDWYNILHPENMLKEKYIFTDITPEVEPRSQVIDKIGKVPMKGLSVFNPSRTSNQRKFHLDHKITNFFVNYGYFHFRHEIGKHFLCATQMYNRIPGHEPMVRKDIILDNLRLYEELNRDRPQCFDSKVFPKSYRLKHLEECDAFFQLINSDEYFRKMITDRIQYLIKVSHDSHRSEGVFLLDEYNRFHLNELFDFGRQCGGANHPLITQQYISNPLLLDMNNKFDFRVYMLVASTNPLIVYYHDGFLRVALTSYDKKSIEKGVHLTNTHLAQKKFNEAKTKKVNGMNEQELKEYHLWSFQDLQTYLLKTEKIQNPKWLDEHLRPAFQKTLVHLVRMSKDSLWPESNVYQLFGIDFMIDDNLDVWFIEANPNPQLHQETKKMSQMSTAMLLDLFDIQYAYYRSRMKRLLHLISSIREEMDEKGGIDYQSWELEYKRAVKNRLELEFRIKSGNSFVPIIDENLSGADAYFGHIPEECF